jgi:predicted Rossmann fold nucleotide-binding protein DprA/Smf involved in DNA uptake
MKVGIVGSRSFSNFGILQKIMTEHLKPGDIVVSGGASGTDSLAEEIAKTNGFKTHIYLPNWKIYGKSAGFIRNKQIVDNSDYIIAMWNGSSKGTKHSIDLAKSQGKTVFVYNFNGSIVK